jgi:hypothetical protein
MLEQIGRFLEMMIVHKPSKAESWLQRIAERFCSEFAFLPLKYGKPLTKRIFAAMRDRSDFISTIRQIKTETLVNKEREWFEKEIKGQVIDAVYCKAPNCGLVLGYGKAIALSNGLVLHQKCQEECTQAGDRTFQTGSEMVKPQPTGKLRWGRKREGPRWEVESPVSTLL